MGQILLMALSMLCGSALAQSQAEASVASPHEETQPGVSERIRKNEFGIWGGGSPISGHVIGFDKDRQLLILGLRYGRVLYTAPQVQFRFIVDAIPFALLFQPGTTPPAGVAQSHRHVYGGGVNLWGLQINFRPRKRLQPFLNSSGGGLLFTEEVPRRSSSAFNFTLEWGLGLEIKRSAMRAWKVGYKYHHISDANLTFPNPGTDSNILYVGYSFYR